VPHVEGIATSILNTNRAAELGVLLNAIKVISACGIAQFEPFVLHIINRCLLLCSPTSRHREKCGSLAIAVVGSLVSRMEDPEGLEEVLPLFLVNGINVLRQDHNSPDDYDDEDDGEYGEGDDDVEGGEGEEGEEEEEEEGEFSYLNDMHVAFMEALIDLTMADTARVVMVNTCFLTLQEIKRMLTAFSKQPCIFDEDKVLIPTAAYTLASIMCLTLTHPEDNVAVNLDGSLALMEAMRNSFDEGDDQRLAATTR
jgi:hypothetical protein